MKKILFFLLSVFFLTIPQNLFAYTESEEVCYAQCATYKFVWQGDYCYDTFQNECAMGSGKTIRETIKFLKGIHDTLKSGSGIDTVFKAWFVCKPLIENCIVPQLRECRSTCGEDQLYYAPDLSVGSPYSNFVYHGVVYNERDQTLTFKVVNHGMGYAWDIGTNASWGHTRNRDGLVSGGGELFSETISELLYAGARNGPPKTVGDYIGDFLIEESNFAKYLQGFKSDADNYDVPAIWYKTIPFTPPGGELTKVTFNVDPNQDIVERSELNNSFVLTIDDLPTPPSFAIENFTQRLEDHTLNSFLIEFSIKNSGEENGQATVKIFENKFNGTNTQTAIYSSSQVVQGLNIFNFNTFIAPDITADDTYCGKTKKYELVVFDNKGEVDSHEFSLPLYSGSVRGRVEDLFGKAVADATVTVSSGQTATTSKNTGSYFIKGINQLGKVTLTVTHPEFSQVETREINFKMGDGIQPCDENNLTFNQVNFVLKDQDVLFSISVKDNLGNPINAHVLATNQDWRFESDVNGEGPLPGMQPGEYFFTISAPGFKTIGQSINAVPSNQNLEFVMEPLNGRLTDGGLTIHEPQLLWQMDRGEEIFAQMAATKDGREVMLYTTGNNSNNSFLAGNLYFLDTFTGQQIKVVSPTISTGGQSQSCLDTSYDGNTTALYVHTGTFGISGDTKNTLKLFNNQGNEIGMTDFKSGGGVTGCDVSPDGFYIFPGHLLNKGLRLYTNREILGERYNTAPMAGKGIHFTTANNIVEGCAQGGGSCVEKLNNTVVSYLGDLNGYGARRADSSQDGNKVAVATIQNAFFFGNGEELWEKDIITRSSPLNISVSPGGKFVIYSTNSEGRNYRTIKIFSDNNLDKTPNNLPDPSLEDVIFVHANDMGMFFATQRGKTIKYYQVGSYSTDYNPTTPTPIQTTDQTTNNISFYDNGIWQGLGEVNYFQLLPGRIYMANQTLTLQVMEPWGKLTFLEGTLFGTDNYLNPVLLKGQMTADFGSAFNIYALKFDRYDLDLFKTKLEQFTAGNLPQSEYFLIQNIHTKFVIKNNENFFSVAVASGQVKITGKDIDQTVSANHQISIDQENNIDDSIFLGEKIYIMIIGVIIIIAGVLLFIYRDTKIGKQVIKIIKIICQQVLKYLKLSAIFMGRMMIKVVPILWKCVQSFFQFIIKMTGKVIKKTK